jgi:hypothetical protein
VQKGCTNEHRCPKGNPIRAAAHEWGFSIRATKPVRATKDKRQLRGRNGNGSERPPYDYLLFCLFCRSRAGRRGKLLYWAAILQNRRHDPERGRAQQLCGSEGLGASITDREVRPAVLAQLERCGYTRCETATRQLTACRSLKSPAIPRPNLDNAAVKMLYYGLAGGSECCILLLLKA